MFLDYRVCTKAAKTRTVWCTVRARRTQTSTTIDVPTRLGQISDWFRTSGRLSIHLPESPVAVPWPVRRAAAAATQAHCALAHGLLAALYICLPTDYCTLGRVRLAPLVAHPRSAALRVRDSIEDCGVILPPESFLKHVHRGRGMIPSG